jgi:hypothetical protein
MPSSEEQHLTAQRDALAARRQHRADLRRSGLAGTSRSHPELRQALAGCRAGDTLVVTKLDRLARSLPDARTLVVELTRRSDCAPEPVADIPEEGAIQKRQRLIGKGLSALGGGFWRGFY